MAYWCARRLAEIRPIREGNITLLVSGVV